MTMLMAQIDGYLRRTGMPPTTFGRRAVNDPRLIGDMRLGRIVGARVAARVSAFIAGAR